MRLTGNFDAKMDKKNRVFVPALFRRILMTRYGGGDVAAALAAVKEESQTASDSVPASVVLYVRKHVFRDCLVLYPENVWDELLAKLRSRLSQWDPVQDDVFRQFVLDAEMVEMDANGRILLPKRLLQQVKIESEVNILGMDDVIEVWPGKVLDKPLVDIPTFQKLIVENMR